jgi:hypothetical protein
LKNSGTEEDAHGVEQVAAISRIDSYVTDGLLLSHISNITRSVIQTLFSISELIIVIIFFYG